MDTNFENNNANMDNHAETTTPFAVQAEGDNPGTHGGMKPIYKKEDGTCVVAMRLKDTGTLERKYLLAVMSADGGVSPCCEFLPSKLTSPKALVALANLDGIYLSDIDPIHKALLSKCSTLTVQQVGESKCSLLLAHRRLTKYVASYMEVERAFIKDSYGCIEATYLQKVIDKLELGYSSLDLERNFKVWALLKSSDKTGHYYTYKIGRKYYFTFKLADVDSTEGGDEA